MSKAIKTFLLHFFLFSPSFLLLSPLPDHNELVICFGFPFITSSYLNFDQTSLGKSYFWNFLLDRRRISWTIIWLIFYLAEENWTITWLNCLMFPREISDFKETFHQISSAFSRRKYLSNFFFGVGWGWFKKKQALNSTLRTWLRIRSETLRRSKINQSHPAATEALEKAKVRCSLE